MTADLPNEPAPHESSDHTAQLPTLGRDLVLAPGFAARGDVLVPPAALLDLPERVVQFGTGAFLRGFVEFFVDEANRRGEFDGRIVAVSSTGSGRDDVLTAQNGLYTLATQGVDAGTARKEYRVVASLSRALPAHDRWSDVLACARNPELELIVSNTTEVGIALDPDDDPALDPPRSFPGKLTRFLLERARAFDFDTARGVVVLPCELIEDNGDRLREIVLALAERWRLGDEFRHWVETAVPFCNTLVDRIVPGAPGADDAASIRHALGYRDDLVTTCEVYRLFAIEADDAVRARIRFAGADRGIVVTNDVRPYRARKVRLLNGTHTISVAAALLCGCETVREAVEQELVGRFIRQALFDELVPGVDAPGAEAFAAEVMDRFANPFIRHALFDITLQGTMKMRVRVVPAIVEYAARTGRVPASLAFGFAAYLAFMRGDLQAERRRAGLAVPADDHGAAVRDRWTLVERGGDLAGLVRATCADVATWGTDLAAVPGFADAVTDHLERIDRDGAPAALAAHLSGAGV